MPLLHHAVVRLAQVTGDIVVVLGPDGAEPAMPPGVPVRFARDSAEGEGPLAGAVAGLAVVDRDLAVVAGGDMPSLSTAVILEMLRVASEAPIDAVALQEGDRFRPLPVVVRVAAARTAAHVLIHEGERVAPCLVAGDAGGGDRRGHLDRPRPGTGDPARRRRAVRPRCIVRSSACRTSSRSRAGPIEVSVDVPGIRVGSLLREECPGHDVDWEAERATHPWAFHDERSWPWHVHAFLARGPWGLAVIDAGVGVLPTVSSPGQPDRDGPPRPRTRSPASTPPRSAVVVLSHLHADHAGGSWAGEGPRFPNARVVLHETDLAFFSDGHEPYVAVPEMERLGELGMLDLDPSDREVAPGLRVVHTPGHTPGHRSIVLEASDERIVITGDLLHVADPGGAAGVAVEPRRRPGGRSGLQGKAPGPGGAGRVARGCAPLRPSLRPRRRAGWRSIVPVDGGVDAP